MMQDLSPSEIEALTRAIGGTYLNREEGSGSKKEGGGESVAIAHTQFPHLTSEETDPETIRHFQQELKDLEVVLEAVLGKTKFSIAKLLKLQPGEVILLDKLAGEKVDVEVNGRVIARAEVVIVEDKFGIKIVEIVV